MAGKFRGAQLGFTFDMSKRGRIYNTFDAHRLLHWAESTGKQKALKEALFAAYFTEEYYQSFKNADQSTSGKLQIRIESFRLADGWEPQINHLLQKLMEPSTWLQELMEISNTRRDDQ